MRCGKRRAGGEGRVDGNRTTVSLRPRVAERRTPGEHVDIASPLYPRPLVPHCGSGFRLNRAEYPVRSLSQMAPVLAVEVGEKAPLG